MKEFAGWFNLDDYGSFSIKISFIDGRKMYRESYCKYLQIYLCCEVPI
jgi:hypothetical protein